MKRKKRNLLRLCSTLLLLLVVSFSFGQTNPGLDPDDTSITLKTMRALFPNTPVAIANEIHGGLHVVKTVDELHGTEITGVAGTDNALMLDDAVLQIGMLVYLESENMYYRYKGEFGGKKNVGGTTTTTTVNNDYWESMADILGLPETITVVDGCTNDYYFTDGSNLPKNNIAANATTPYKLDKDGPGTAASIDLPEDPLPGDHLILMQDDSSSPIATYVYDGEDKEWKLISAGTKVYNTTEMSNNNLTIVNDRINQTTSDGNTTTTTDITDQFSEGDVFQVVNDNGATETYIHDGEKLVKIEVDDNDMVETRTITYANFTYNPSSSNHSFSTPLPSNLQEGDLVKLIVVDSNDDPTGSYVTWAREWDNGSWTWVKIAEYTSDVDEGLFKVYYDITSTTNATNPTGSIVAMKSDFNATNGTTIEAKDIEDFRKKLITSDTPTTVLEESDSADGNVIILYYPAAWDDFIISIDVAGAKYELTNGIKYETVTANSVDNSLSSGYYKKVTVRSGDGGKIYID